MPHYQSSRKNDDIFYAYCYKYSGGEKKIVFVVRIVIGLTHACMTRFHRFIDRHIE